MIFVIDRDRVQLVAIVEFEGQVRESERSQMGAKRQRVSSRCKQDTRKYKSAQSTLDSLPPEILSIILRMLSLHDIACVVRLVSR